MGVPYTSRTLRSYREVGPNTELGSQNNNLETILRFYEKTGADDIIKMLWVHADYQRFRTGLGFAEAKRSVEETIRELKGIVRTKVNRRQALGRLRQLKIETYLQYWESYLGQDLDLMLRDLPADTFIHGSPDYTYVDPLASSTISIPRETWDLIDLIGSDDDNSEGNIFDEHMVQIRNSLNQGVVAIGLNPILSEGFIRSKEVEEIPF